MEKHPQQTLLTLKKSFYYDFIPSKLEEDECKMSNRPYQVSKSLVEIRDVYLPPHPHPANPWRICRTLTLGEVMSGQIVISRSEAFEHVFRFWSLDMTKIAVAGNKLHVVVWDLSEESSPVSVSGEKSFFEKGCDEGYNLGVMDLVKSRSINPNDEIGLYWDAKPSAFIFKLLGRSSGQT